MKKSFVLFLFAGFYLPGWAQTADFDLNIIAQPATIVLNNIGNLNVSTCNVGGDDIVANSVVITIKAGMNAEILGIHVGSDPRFTIRNISTGNGNTIELANTGGTMTSPGGSNSCASINLDIKGTVLSGATNIDGLAAYIPGPNALLGGADNATQGNDPGNDGSTTSLKVATTLPVTLSSFTATATGTQALLNWAYQDATQFSHFELERSSDGVAFSSLNGKSYYPANTTQNGLLRFAETDTRPATGNNYYRLKIVDVDGHYVYSRINVLAFGNQRAGISAYPNPAVDNITVEATALRSKGRLKVYNLAGTVVYEGVATSKTQVNTAPLARGTYLVAVFDADGLRVGSSKFLKLSK